MIDIGLTKLALIGVVALVVIGPEKLPTVARMAGSLFGRAQRYINDLKAEVSREIELDQFRKMQQDMQEVASDIEQSIDHSISEAQRSIYTAWNDNVENDVGIDGNDIARFSLKAKKFRKKKLAHISAIPSWYKNQHGRKVRVISGAARVAKYRPAGKGKNSASFY